MLFFAVWLMAWSPPSAQESQRPVVRLALEQDEAILGQPTVLRVTLLVPTWLLKAPVFPSFEIPNIIVRLPERASGPTSEEVDGETWSGVTRAYRLYPMTSGRFSIPPLPIEITYADPRTREPVAVELRTADVVFQGVAPEGAEDLDPFIAAQELTLEQTIEGEPGDLEPGGAVSRTVEAQIKGMSPIFLPELVQAASASGVALYPKEPVVTEIEERGILSGERVEQVVYVGQAGGRYTAPAISLRWFNLKTNQIETAELPGFDIVVQGTPPPPPSDVDWRRIVPWIIGASLATVLIGLLIRRLWPPFAAWRKQRRETYLRSEAFAFTQAEKALRARRFSDATQAVDLWRSRLPVGFGKHDADLSVALARLGAGFYRDPQSPVPDSRWSEAVQSLRAARREHIDASARANDALPPLNPHSA